MRMKLKHILLFLFLTSFAVSCSWMSEKWNKRPDWLMPDKTSGQQVDSSRIDKELITGFNFALKAKKNGAGQFTVNFSIEAEFNDIYEWLMK